MVQIGRNQPRIMIQRGRPIAVAEHGGDVGDVCTGADEVRGARMAQRMRMTTNDAEGFSYLRQPFLKSHGR